MQGSKGQLDGGRFLTRLYHEDSEQAAFMQRIIDAVNNLGKSVAASSAGEIDAPPPVDSIAVKTAGEMLHVTLTHNPPIQRGIRYFTEIDTNPSFTQPHVYDMGTSRGTVLTLPTKTDGGSTVNYYVRAYPQYSGSKPAPPTVYGGMENPTAITMGGSTSLTLLTSTGSGTAQSNGQQGGYGLGKQQVRPALGPKRQVA